MNIDTFHLFPSLPPEIRREVFLLATPPRIVQLQQRHEILEDFLERFRNLNPWDIELHPSLAYFARNWSEVILSYKDLRSQRKLEDYGFTTSCPAQRPWEPSDSTPEIPVNWLFDHPKVAYEFLGKSYVYSKAPIPALLHTCVESRRVLIDAGYQLAFASRNHEPRTWFHFGRDLLYLKTLERAGLRLLDPSPWGTGSIDPQSLQQVQRLVVGGRSIFPFRAFVHDTTYSALSAMQLLPNLEKIYFVLWDLPDLSHLSHSEAQLFWKSSRSSTRSSPAVNSNRDSISYRREPWRFILKEEVDALFPLTVRNLYQPTEPSYAGHSGWNLTNYGGPTGTHYSYLTRYIRNRIEEDIDRDVKKESIAPYQVPELEFGHICTEVVARQVFNKRHEVWRQYELAMKREPPPQPRLPPMVGPRPTSPADLQWKDNWKSFDDEAYYSSQAEWLAVKEALLKHINDSPPRRQLLLEP
ncbi:hypothetical protein K445DRAFT_26333 [Daldinia sp. EC12]|nr:hypothetical protein K445DRAFT_26333 [Daldinia sp. EC12]